MEVDMMKKFSVLILVLGLAILLWVPTSQATPIMLSDGNSQAFIDPDSQAGMNRWLVDGINMLYQQWFWYRIGDTAEVSIDSLSAPAITQLAPNKVTTVYASAGVLEILIDYTLYGGAPGSTQADIGELIRIKNLGGSSINLSFFQYTDFDLGGPGGDYVTLANANTFRHWNPIYASTETVGTPAPNYYEAGYYPNTLNSLNDGSPTTLSNVVSAGPGDVTWAWQWNRTLAPGGTFLISKDKNIGPIPEPGTLMLLGSGLLGLAVYGKVRISRKKK
jgi:hypothetical protein